MIGAILQRHRNEAAHAAPLAHGALPARVSCLLFAMALATSASAQSARERLPDASIVGPQVIERTNALRSRHGLTAVESDANLAEAAQKFAEFMARTERYGHEADARRPADRAAAEGYEHCMVAENIAYVFSSSGFTSEQLASRLVAGWWQSPGHR
ncbi:MAG: Cysteine-rich secretory protein family protein, partial [Burkholderiaceae bacterium]|nr:Cysteine-rich secretory protein family protein [Burkholderiaceae bacterium]